MKLGIVVYSSDPETVWNAFRFANAIPSSDEAKVFLIGRGVEWESLDTNTFKVTEQIERFVDAGGKILICSTCLEIHRLKAPEKFILATLKELLDIVKESDKIITF